MPKFERRLSHTSTSSFRRCRMQYKWKYLLNYAPPASPPLIKGSCGHAAMGAGYMALAEKKDFDTVVDLSLKAASAKLAEFEEEADNEMTDIWDDMSIIVPRYFEWAAENDDFIAHEIEYKFLFEIDDFDVIGYFDGIVERSNGTLWLLEHKFTKQVRIKHLEIDPQVSLYMLAARAEGFDIRGVLYNVVRTTIGGKAQTEPVARLPVFRNNEGLEQIAVEAIYQMREMRAFHESNGENAYRTPTQDCSWDCGFFNACLAMNDDGDPIPALRQIPVKTYKKKGE